MASGKKTAGSLLEYTLGVQTTGGEQFSMPPRHLQIGLSGEPLVLVSQQGGHRLTAVDTKTLFAIDEMSLLLCDVVTNVIDSENLFSDRLAKNSFKTLPHKVSKHMTVGKGIICSGTHSGKVIICDF